MKHRIVIFTTIVLLLLLCCLYPAQPQNLLPQLDSLKKAVLLQTSDSVRAETFLLLSDGYKYTDPGLAFFYADSAYFLASSIQNLRLMGTAKALKGIYFKLTGDFKKSLECYLVALDFSSKMQDTISSVAYLSNIGNLYFSLKDYQKSETYFQQALAFEKSSKHQPSIAAICINLSAIHIDGTKNYDKAISYLGQALDISNRINETRLIIPSLINLSEVYFHQKAYGKSLNTLKKADSLAMRMEDRNSQAYIQYCYGRVFKELKDYENSLTHLESGLLLARKFKLKSIEQKIEKEEAEAHALSKNYKQAYMAQERYTQLNDSLTESQRQMLISHKDHEEIYSQLKIHKAESVSINLARQKDNYIYGGLALGTLAVAFTLLFYIRKEKLANKNRIIEEDNKMLASNNIKLKGQLEQLASSIGEQRDQDKPESKKYANSSLSQYEREEYMQRLLDFMDEEEPYLNPELDLATLSQAIAISSHHVSEILNVCLQKKFYDFINLYRVEAMKRKIVDEHEAHKKILAIAYEVGFNSKTAFNNAFKKNTGLTPSAYRNAQLDTVSVDTI